MLLGLNVNFQNYGVPQDIESYWQAIAQTLSPDKRVTPPRIAIREGRSSQFYSFVNYSFIVEIHLPFFLRGVGLLDVHL